MKNTFWLYAIGILIFSGCEREIHHQEPYVGASHNPQNVQAAVTAEQTMATEKLNAEKQMATVVSLVADGKISSDASKALAELYGGLVWRDSSLSQYFKEEEVGYVAPMFEKRFTEEDVEKLAVIGHITPGPTDDYHCHACSRLVGGAIFRRQGSDWIVESSQMIIGWGGSLSDEVINVVKIGPTKRGISIRVSDVNHGYEFLREEILVPRQGRLDTALNVGYKGQPGPAACLDEGISLPNQGLDIRFEPGSDPEYFEAVAHLEYNEGKCSQEDSWIAHKETTRYLLQDGKYRPI